MPGAPQNLVRSSSAAWTIEGLTQFCRSYFPKLSKSIFISALDGGGTSSNTWVLPSFLASRIRKSRCLKPNFCAEARFFSGKIEGMNCSP
ncbi:hypothetical protein E2320_014966, partial [Naja naja]